MTFIASMRRHSQVKTPWADFPFFLHSVEFSCVNDSLTSVDFRRRLLSVKRGGCSGPLQALHHCARRGFTRGRQPLLRGEPAASMRAKRFFLARSVLPAWGEPTPPRLALGGNGKGGSNSLLPQAISVISAQLTDTIAPRRRCRLAVLFFAASCSVGRQPPRRLASIRTRK